MKKQIFQFFTNCVYFSDFCVFEDFVVLVWFDNRNDMWFEWTTKYIRITEEEVLATLGSDGLILIYKLSPICLEKTENILQTRKVKEFKEYYMSPWCSDSESDFSSNDS